MDWSNDLCLDFIGLYENQPVIWNPCHPGHKNRHTVSAAWKAIQDQLNVHCTIVELKRKKESLMASYRTCLAKVRSNQGKEDPYKPSWFAFEKMDKFLRERNKRFDPTYYNVPEQEYNEPNFVEIEEENYETAEPLALSLDPTEDTDSESNRFSEGNHAVHITNFEIPNSPELRPGKRYRIEHTEIPVNHNTQATVHDTSKAKSLVQKETEFDIWAKSIAFQLNNMDLGRALNLQLQIQTLVTNERLGNEVTKRENMDYN
ncbi:uncharacterized protein LOC126737426 [Anthonomus grandis grandis]|uniref:uncharacterized protein LOC126737426 n=1 Tax=Anthonomus grandis grandis TaxID=2921223 RepID=UPI0021663A39|nr:uncharacterized protein LOC126737426 [Anthonomus grandis grandis]